MVTDAPCVGGASSTHTRAKTFEGALIKVDAEEHLRTSSSLGQNHQNLNQYSGFRSLWLMSRTSIIRHFLLAGYHGDHMTSPQEASRNRM